MKYELRPGVKKLYQMISYVSAASRFVNLKHEELCSAVSKELYQMRPKLCGACLFVVSRIANCNHMSCIERHWYTNVQHWYTNVQQYEDSYTIS